MATINSSILKDHRSSCVSPSSHGSSSSVSSATYSSNSCENPLMALVDAAASLLADKEPSPQNSIPLAVEVVQTTPSPVPTVDANKKQTFAESLMSILEDPQYEDVIAWMPDGKAFTIKNHKKFTRELMPKLFNIRNMSSFVRKLTRWGFTRVHEKETCNSDIFKHVHFQKDNWELCRQVKCMGRVQVKAAPVSINNKPFVVDLTTLDRPHLLHSSSSPSSTRRMASPQSDMASTNTRSTPCASSLVTPPTADKALLRLEQARRMSANSRPRVFGGRCNRNTGNTIVPNSNMVEAAMATFRRDEETVIVAMPKKYLQATHRPGMRVISGGFVPPSHQAPHHQQLQQQQQRHPAAAAGNMMYPFPPHPHFHPCHHHPPMLGIFQQQHHPIMRRAPVPLHLRPANMPLRPYPPPPAVPPAAGYSKAPVVL